MCITNRYLLNSFNITRIYLSDVLYHLGKLKLEINNDNIISFYFIIDLRKATITKNITKISFLMF